MHCSPPSIAVLRAAEHALAVNRLQGDGARFYLSQLVERFRSGLRQIGLAAQGGLFPLQMLAVAASMRGLLHLRLLCRRHPDRAAFAAAAASGCGSAFSSPHCIVRRTSIVPSRPSIAQPIGHYWRGRHEHFA